MRKRKQNNHSRGRILYHFPIIHTQADMGNLAEMVSRSAIRELGQQVWQRKLLVVDRMWDGIERFLEDLQLPFGRVRLYQDGLPVCGREADIVRDLASKGSRNHRLLLRLMGKGGTIMGTESPEFLVEEYRLARQVLSGDAPAGEIDQQELLGRRDRFIARRINSTLLRDEIGILFLGMLHSLDDLLEADIQVISVPPASI
jgi:hypothetical protein